MFFWNSLAFCVIQRMLAIWSLVPLPLWNPACVPGRFMIGSSFSSVDNLPLVIFPPFSQHTATGNLGQIITLYKSSCLLHIFWDSYCVFVFSKLSISHTFEFGFPGASGKEPTCQCRRHKRCRFDPWIRKTPLEKGMATHSSILAWRSPWTEEPGGLQSTGLHRVRRD